MVDLTKTKEDPRTQLWDQIEKVYGIMVGSPDHTQHMQPMSPQVARDEQKIWFFTSVETDLLKAVRSRPADVHVCVIGKDHDYHACLRGSLVENRSREHVDRFWSSVVDAWYPDGKDDPKMTMLCFTPKDAKIWASSGSSIGFGWALAKAQLTDKEPDVGVDVAINF